MFIFRTLVRNKWLVLATLFLAVNTCAVCFYFMQQQSLRDVRVELISPKHGQVASKDILKWRFSTDMVSAFNLGIWSATGPVIFSPEVKGSFAWTKPNELSFQPDSRWPGCTEFQAVFMEDMRSLDLRSLAVPPVFNFHSSPLALQRVSQVDHPSEQEARICLEFTDKVSVSQLRSHLKLESPSGTPIHYGFDRHGSRAHITIVARNIPGNEIVVNVSAGLQSTTGPLALETNSTWPLTLTRELRIQHVSPVVRSLSSAFIKVGFSAPIKLATASEFIRVVPHLETSVEPYHSYYQRNQCRILGDFSPGRSYTITFLAGLSTAAGTILKNDVTRSVYFPDPEPALEFVEAGNYLSPMGNLLVPMRFVNINKYKVIVRRIYPNNLVQLAVRRAGRYYGYYRQYYQGLSRVIGKMDVPVNTERSNITESNLDLRPLLEGKYGAFHIDVRGDNGGHDVHFVVVSDIGLTVKSSDKDLLVWANSLRSLEALTNAPVKVYSFENQLLFAGLTDAQGTASFAIDEKKIEGEPFIVTVEQGEDITFLRLGNSHVNVQGAIGRRHYLDEGYEAYLFTDRGIYRPGEVTRLKAIVRGKNVTCPEVFPVKLKVYRPDGKIDRVLNAMLGQYGTAEFDISWPDFVATGKYRLELSASGAETVLGMASIAIEEFVPPQIRTSINTSNENIVADKEFEFEIFSEYLFGRPAAGLMAEANIDFMPHPFKCPQKKGFSFGDSRRNFRTVQTRLGKKFLSSSGKAVFRAKASSKWRPSAAIKALIVGTVTEISGRSVTAYASRIIHIYPFYIGVRCGSDRIRVGWPGVFEIISVQPDGTSATGVDRLKVSVDKFMWVSVLKKDENGNYRYRSEQQMLPVSSKEVLLNSGRTMFEFIPRSAGNYRLSVMDPASDSSSSIEFYAGTSGQVWNDRSMEAPDVVELKLDKKEYRVGDTARLTIVAPFPGKALVTIESSHVIDRQVFVLTNNSLQLDFTVKPEYSPNVYCAVSLIRPVVSEETWGQHRAAGFIALIVDTPARKLQVKMKVPARIRPKEKLTIPVLITDATRKGVKAELVVAAVDEAICMLTGFASPDPYGYFFEPRLPGVGLYDLYARLMPEVTDKITGGESDPGGARGMMSALRKRLNPIKARRFKPVALWSSTVVTDEDGKANIEFDVPEFTGQLRLMAVALDRARFGFAEEFVKVKRSLIVQSSLPRFLAPSDSFIMPVRVFNETGHSGEALVKIVCDGPLTCGQGKISVMTNLFLAKGAGTNIDFLLQAMPVPGKATCRLEVSMGAEQFAETTEIAVRPPVPYLTLSGSGILSPGKQTVLAVPARWLQNTGSSEIWLSALPNIRLKGSLDYLVRYPYGCLEQTTSKSFPLLYLSELAERTYPGWLNREEISRMVQGGIHRILSMQRGNGGFSLWPGCKTYVWGTIYATHFLAEATTAGYDVPGDRVKEACDFLEQWLAKRVNDVSGSAYDKSYACFVLALAKRPQHGAVARLMEQKKKMDWGTRVNLAAALVAAGKRRDALELLGSMGSGALIRQEHQLGGSLRSGVRNNALLLSTWLSVDPENHLIPVLAKRLESARNNGRWCTTQDNAMALMALGKYCRVLASSRKPISGQVSWDTGTRSSAFTNENLFHIALKNRQDKKIIISNRGQGAIYYHWKSEGIPIEGRVAEIDKGIEVRRELLDLDGHPVASAELKQGELFVMKITLDTAGTLDNVVIEDLLPAGLEIENASLKTSKIVKWIDKKKTLPLLFRTVRDDRMLAFTGSFSGKQSFFYALRAVTVGDFVFPAISASCMYDPEIRSINGRKQIRITSQK